VPLGLTIKADGTVTILDPSGAVIDSITLDIEVAK
jgi:hypothetical protein